MYSKMVQSAGVDALMLLTRSKVRTRGNDIDKDVGIPDNAVKLRKLLRGRHARQRMKSLCPSQD
jgi:hypothetical protein